jgi:hypothetical protein
MNQLLQRIPDWLMQRRLAVVVSMLLVTVLAGLQIPKLRADFTPNDLFAQVEAEQAIVDEFRATFGNTDNVLLLLVEAPDIFDPAVLQYIRDVADEFKAQPWSARVTSIATLPLPRPAAVAPAPDAGEPTAAQAIYRRLRDDLATVAPAFRSSERDNTEPPTEPAWLGTRPPVADAPATAASIAAAIDADEATFLRQTVSTSPLLNGQLVSADSTLATIVIELSQNTHRAADIAVAVNDARARVAARPAPDQVLASWAGLPYLRTALVERMRADQKIMLPGAIIVCFIILLMAFRWLPGILLPLAVVVMTVVQVVGAMAAVGEPFNILNNIIPLLLIIIGISDAIHLISRYAEELRAGESAVSAAVRTMRTMAVACFMTSITTAVGFATLLVSHTQLLRHFGFTAAAGVMLAYILTILFIPATLPWLRVPATTSGAGREGWLEDTVESITHRVMRRPWLTLLASLVVFGAAGFYSSRVIVDAAVLDQFDADDDIYVSTHKLEDRLAGFRPLEVYLRAPAGRLLEPDVSHALDAVATWARTQDSVLRTTSWLTYAREARAGVAGADSRELEFTSASQLTTWLDVFANAPQNPVRAYLSEETTAGRLNLAVRDVGAAATIELADALNQVLREQFASMPDIEVSITGDAYTSSLGLRSVIADLAGSLGLATILIFLLMVGMFRSLRLGLVSIPPNVLPLLLTLAFMGWRGIPLNAATVIIFSVSIGLAVDGTIHVLARFREEQARGLSTEEAMSLAARGSGKAIVLTSLSLMFGFSVMLFSAFVPVQRFGILIGISMTSCLLATLFLLPALIAVTWPNRPRVGAESASSPS